ncbi:MAG: DUF4914 family protein [Eubacteriales bacterium]|nr:DUF4914 family protein [Eubacteriales bacterium]MDD4711173.1 DUF4914 family protein [Eubacteriales bacterium]
MIDAWRSLSLPWEMESILASAPKVALAQTREEILAMALGGQAEGTYDVAYDVPGLGMYTEATVAKCANGLAVNYPEPYMRRRDPDCLVVADEMPTDKPKYKNLYGEPFFPLRQEVFEWLKNQPLLVLPFWAGGESLNCPALLIGPCNAAFFAGGLADLQGFIPASELPAHFAPKAVVYLAPPFRHTHFSKKQVVVHNRTTEMHEIFSFNLYPGPSAKKGIYGALIHIGEMEGWLTLHGSTVKVVTPYDNSLVILHEGASGSGKSEMIEQMHLEPDGRILLAQNTISGEKMHLSINETCELLPVTDDMALCQESFQNGGRRLVVKDAEAGWFLRVNHITHYGTDPQHESLCVHPKEPLIFLNMKGVPDSTCLIWEHIMDAPGQPCPNPRVIMPRHHVPGVINEPVEVDVRSFGVRTPPCTSKNPTYGIIGMMHVLPPALAWLWRLVAPRGHNNPSITRTAGMTGEGVGSYWPFATGRMVDQANLLLRQIIKTPSTRYKLIPNQYIGAYHVGFMPQWITREYLARRGSVKFRPDQTVEARCPLLGYALESLKIDGNYIPRGLLQTNLQLEVGEEAYDLGAGMLADFFAQELAQFRTKDLDDEGKRIIDCFFDGGSVDDFNRLI